MTVNQFRADETLDDEALALIKGALLAVLVDAGLEDDYEQRNSDGRFIGKAALLKVREAALKMSRDPLP